jgi:hypothetical protein
VVAVAGLNGILAGPFTGVHVVGKEICYSDETSINSGKKGTINKISDVTPTTGYGYL